MTKMGLPDGMRSYAYHEVRKKIVETDQRNHTTAFEGDEGGRLQKIIDPLQHVTSFARVIHFSDAPDQTRLSAVRTHQTKVDRTLL